jgi:hypothetical protein
MKKYRAILGPIGVVVLFAIGMRWSPFEPHRPPADPSGAPSGTASWQDEDWDVFASTVQAAEAEGLAALPMGDLMAEIGQRLVGTAYVPRTLEVDGPERLVINFRGLDCVTFVENVHALATLIKAGTSERLDDRGRVEGEYERAVQSLRYRNGFVSGYSSRLHYFTDWIADAQRKLLVTDITRELGGVPDREPIDFMSTHPDAYRQLADPDAFEDIVRAEARLNAQGRFFIPEGQIADVEAEIRSGDIIAATSTVAGLDVAHTGLALWVDGTLRLLHAPLVGEAVQVSETSLAERILRIDGQDGIIVARPHEPGAPTVGTPAVEGR